MAPIPNCCSKLVVELMLLLLLAFLLAEFPRTCHSISVLSRCSETERKALMELKEGLHDPGNRLSSWAGDDCCAWRGVRCDNRTAHIVGLHLRGPNPMILPVDTEVIALPVIVPPEPRYSYYDYNDHHNDPFFRHDTTRCFSGGLNPSLIALSQLRYLDLSANCFHGLRIPNFLGSFKKLRYLNLSISGFSGVIPRELGNLSTLHTLDISMLTMDEVTTPLYVDSLHWLSHLTSLQYLNMAYVNLSEASSHWVQALNTLPSLRQLHLHESFLTAIPHSLGVHLNFTSLTVLDISSNSFYSTLPAWLFNLSKLETLNVFQSGFQGPVPVVLGDVFPLLQVLDLSFNYDLRLGNIPKTLGNLCQLQKLFLWNCKIGQELAELQPMFSSCMADNLETLNLGAADLTGSIPQSIGNLKKLKRLYLSSNQLVGPLPVTLGRLSSLQELDLRYNELNGTIFTGTWQLPAELEYLDLSGNSLEGTLSEESLSTFAKVKHLQLGKNSFVMEVNADWEPPFQLESFSVSFCKLGPRFPAWLRTQVNLSFLDMSYASISDKIPLWFWNLTSQFYFLDISFNNITGQLPRSLMFSTQEQVGLNSNLFYGPVPQIISGDVYLDLSNNSLSGPLPPMIHESWQNVRLLSLSMNKINGSIPSGFCKMELLDTLDLSENLLSGDVPDCWSTISVVRIIKFGGNNLSGDIPKSLCSLSKLLQLNLRANSLTGELPSCLKHCSDILSLDLGQNKLSGMITDWIGESLPQLQFLRLDSNKFKGVIPPQLSLLAHLYFLDLSFNNLSGTIPSTFGYFPSLRHEPHEESLIFDKALIAMKGIASHYDATFYGLPKVIDLSNNHLTGSIPEEVTKLRMLQSLNLSSNLLTGHIPLKIGALQYLESLDLSRNMLSGHIPESLSTLTFIESMNLSYNNLSGRIPSGNQLSTFNDPSIYAGNANLCGLPVDRLCQNDISPTSPRINSSGNGNNQLEDEEQVWFYVGLAPGFVVGIWIIFGVLILKRTWRYSYFRYVDSMYDRLYVVTWVNAARLKHKIWSCRNEGPAPGTL